MVVGWQSLNNKFIKRYFPFSGCIAVSFCLPHTLVSHYYVHVCIHIKEGNIIIGTMTSLITKPRPPQFINSVDKLVRQDIIKWTIEPGSAYSTMGKTAEEGSTMRHEIFVSKITINKL